MALEALCIEDEIAQYVSNMVRIGDKSGGAISQLSSASVGRNRVVTAVRTKTGTLAVTQWRGEDDGAVSRLGTGTGGNISELSEEDVDDITAYLKLLSAG